MLVSAPTGSGKTLVADYAMHRAVSVGGKAFYTTPLKALSNQKYAELSRRYGTERVGLLTGDTALRPEAPVVVMTTEVLRNMLLAGSDLLEGLCVVVLDEVHYLQDPYRGGVWEEVLVLSPPRRHVRLPLGHRRQRRRAGRLAALGARADRRGRRAQRRPITLRHHFAVHRRETRQTTLVPLLERRTSRPMRACGWTRPPAGRPRGASHSWRARA